LQGEASQPSEDGANEAVAAAYDFSTAQRVVDVGGGHGQLLSLILAKNPHLSGVLLDTPSGIASAKAGAGGPLPRTELIAGDFFKAVPAGGDIYALKRVIHDWDDERASLILRNCRDAMKPGGSVLVAERIIDEGNDRDINKYLDIVMLTILGGKERAKPQYVELFSHSGLRLDRVIDTSADISVLVGRAA